MRIGITGGICTGKTGVLTYLEEKGYKTLKADEVAHDLMKKGERNYRGIIRFFGEDILDSSGEIDRRKLGSIVFNDEDKRRKLEEITHIGVMEELMDQSMGDFVYFLEIPLLFEGGFEKWVDDVWVIDCLPETQLYRMIGRDNLTKEEGEKRISAQMSRKERLNRGYSVISTENGREDTKKQIDKLLEALGND